MILICVQTGTLANAQYQTTADNNGTGDYPGPSILRDGDDCSPLLYTPTDHSYMAEVEMIIEGEAKGGLVIFYNNRAYSGILADRENILANIKG